MNDVNLLRHNDEVWRHNDEVWRHHFIIFVKVVNDATPCFAAHEKILQQLAIWLKVDSVLWIRGRILTLIGSYFVDTPEDL